MTTKTLLGFLARNNPRGFNAAKACEEAVEFQEVLLKLQTKHADNKPDAQLLIGEYGDFVYRGLIAIMSELPNMSLAQVNKAVEDHIQMKLSKLEGYRVAGKYKGGL